MSDLHRREADHKDKPWKTVVIWLTALGGLSAFLASASVIGSSASVIVHAKDYVESIPCMQKELSDHETRIQVQEDRWKIVSDWMRRHDE